MPSEGINLSAEEKRDIQCFLSVVDAVRGSALFRNGFYEVGLSFTPLEDTDLHQVDVVSPEEEQLKAALSDVRQLYLKREPCELRRIHNVLWKAVSDPDTRNRLAFVRGNYRRTMKTGGQDYYCLIDENCDSKLSPEEALDLWYNGQYFHHDRKKQDRLAGRGAIIVADRVVFLWAVQNVVRHAFEYEKIVKELQSSGVI